jgi:hypothetical protein
MVSIRLSAGPAAILRTAAGAAALILAAACRREQAPAQDAPGDQPAGAALAETVRARYTAPDVEAAGAWVWVGRDSLNWVLVDAQSTVQGIVQARAELWLANGQAAELYGRSEVLPSVAAIGAYVFEDLSGDGVPDLLGFVSDSSEISYPVFFPGSRPGMNEEIAMAAPGWRFSIEEEHAPQAFAEAGVTCAIQLWAEDGAPDGRPAGWRWLAMQRDGGLLAPAATPPSCAGGGVQPGTTTP